MKTFPRLLLFLLCGSLILSCLPGCSRKRAPVAPSATSPQYMEAQELKLKVRELADQLLATLPNDCLTGLVALPTSFVNVNDFQQTSTFGRLVAESLIYEFNQRSFPVREYRLPGYIAMRPDHALGNQGDFALARQGMVNAQEKWAALLLGTYYRDKDAVFVNARLVRAADGMVLRSAQLILVNNALVNRLTTPPPAPVQVALNTTTNAGAGKNAGVTRSATLSTGTLTIQQAPQSRKKPTKSGPGLWGQGRQQ